MMMVMMMMMMMMFDDDYDYDGYDDGEHGDIHEGGDGDDTPHLGIHHDSDEGEGDAYDHDDDGGDEGTRDDWGTNECGVRVSCVDVESMMLIVTALIRQSTYLHDYWFYVSVCPQGCFSFFLFLYVGVVVFVVCFGISMFLFS